MKTNRRKDNSGRVLKEGEYQRTSGTYEFKWRDKRGNRHSISAPTLEELRDKELDALRDVLNGVRTDKENLTILPKVKEAFLLERKFQEELEIKSEATIDGYRDFIFVNRFGNVQHQGTLNKQLIDVSYRVTMKHICNKPGG